jgi:hypothetical protein
MMVYVGKKGSSIGWNIFLGFSSELVYRVGEKGKLLSGAILDTPGSLYSFIGWMEESRRIVRLVRAEL